MSSNKYCPFCGAENAATNQFCANCGADMSSTGAQPVAAPPPQQPMYAQPTTTVYTAPPAQPTSNKGLAGFIIGIIVLVVFSWGAWFFSPVWLQGIELVLAIVGIILSAQGMKEPNKTFGTIGLVFNILGLISILVAMIYLIYLLIWLYSYF